MTSAHKSVPIGVSRSSVFFYFKNVALVPKDRWDIISSFLYGIKPEFVYYKFFSATAMRRGYVHILAIDSILGGLTPHPW
jgi:hypothetical protein